MKKGFISNLLKCFIVVLTILVSFDFSYVPKIFAMDTNTNETTSEEKNEIQGVSKKELSSNAAVFSLSNETKIDASEDISAYIDIDSLKAWINGSLVYEKGNTPSFPDSIYIGASFKLALNWTVADAKHDALTKGDYFTVPIGKIQGLGFEATKTEKLYIDNIYVGDSTFQYSDSKELSYKVVFNENISYFNQVKGYFSSNSTFTGLTTGTNIKIILGTIGSGEITVIKKPSVPDIGNTGIGVPSVTPISKDFVSIGKSTFSEDLNSSTFGWRIVFTDLIQKSQTLNNGSTYDKTEYSDDLIIEDTLDENQVFVEDVEYGYGGPFFMDILLMLPGTQSAVAYSGSVTDDRVRPVVDGGNGNSDYIIKPKNFKKLGTEEEVRNTPLSWTIVEVDQKQKLVINAGKLGTTDKANGITRDMIEKRYDSVKTDITVDGGIETVINNEIARYNGILNGDFSPKKELIKKFEAFKKIYDSAYLAEISAYETTFNAFINQQTDTEFTGVVPKIPDNLKVANFPQKMEFGALEYALTNYELSVANYKNKINEKSYKDTISSLITSLDEAKHYYKEIGNRLYGFSLKYKTKVVNPSSGVVTNDANITTGALEYDVTKEYRHSLSSGISGVFSKGDVVIVKADKANQYTEAELSTSKKIQGLANVSFEVYEKDTGNKLNFYDKTQSVNNSYQVYSGTATGDHFTSTLVTDENGKLIISGLSSKKEYYLKEVSTIDGFYETQNQTIPLTVDSSKVNYKLVENVARTVSFTKKDEETKDVLKDVTFALYTDKDVLVNQFTKEVIKDTTYFTYNAKSDKKDVLMTQENGTLTLKNLPAGTYYFKEVSAPTGYVLSEDKYTFTLEKDYDENKANLVLDDILNIKESASVSLKKLAEKDSVGEPDLPLKGAAFALYKRVSGDAWSSGTHNEWQLITKDQYNLNYSYATDQELDGDALLTDEEGNILISKLPAGDYYLKEIKAPEGYVLEGTHYHFRIGAKAEPADLFVSNTEDETNVQKVENNVVTNKKGTGSIALIKYDREAGATVHVDGVGQTNLNQVFNEDALITVKKPLQGVGFDLYLQKGNQPNTAVDLKLNQTLLLTDEQGKLKVDQLEVGTYYFVEVSTLTNYQLDKTPIMFKITHDDVQTDSKTLVCLADNLLIQYQLLLTKVDAATKSPLAGAEFELRDFENNVVKFSFDTNMKHYVYDKNGSSTLKTNENGQLLLGGLIPGEYTFVETKAPEGYQLDHATATSKVTIKVADDAYDSFEPIVTKVQYENTKIKEPEKPVDPEKPTEPEQPVEPEQPKPEEPVVPEIPENPTPETPETPSVEQTPNRDPDTGDTTNFALWLAILGFSSGFMGLAYVKKKGNSSIK